MTSTTTGPAPTPWPSRHVRDARVATPQRPGRHRAAGVSAPVTGRAWPPATAEDRLPIPAPRPAPAIPAPRRPVAPPPPRPAVGSGVGRGAATPGTRHVPRNGVGLAALVLAAVGLPFGLVPLTGFVASGLGVLGIAFGIAGWRRARRGTASNTPVAVTGATLGLLVLALGVVGTVAFLHAPDHPVYDLARLGVTGAAAPASNIIS